MKRLTTAPNLAMAYVWVDLLRQAGTTAYVLNAFASGLAGLVPVNEILPELWIDNESDLSAVKQQLDELINPLHRFWRCPQCQEHIEGPFEECWNCGTEMP